MLDYGLLTILKCSLWLNRTYSSWKLASIIRVVFKKNVIIICTQDRGAATCKAMFLITGYYHIYLPSEVERYLCVTHHVCTIWFIWIFNTSQFFWDTIQIVLTTGGGVGAMSCWVHANMQCDSWHLLSYYAYPFNSWVQWSIVHIISSLRNKQPLYTHTAYKDI